MAKISEMPATTGPLPSGSLIPVVREGDTYKIPIEELQKFIATSGTPFIITDGLGNDFEIIVSGGNLIIPTYVDLPSAQTITGRKKFVVPGESNSLRVQETDGSTGIDIYNDETGLRKTWLRQFDNNSSIAIGRYLGGGFIETWNVLLALETIRLWASRQVTFYDSGLVLSAGIGCTGAGVINLTNASTAGGTFGAVAYTPSQITSDQNNYASIHGRSMQIRLSSDAARAINGITAGVDGETHVLRNVGSYAITFSHLSGSATGAQIYCDTLTTTALEPGARGIVEYDATSGVWVFSKRNNNYWRGTLGADNFNYRFYDEGGTYGVQMGMAFGGVSLVVGGGPCIYHSNVHLSTWPLVGGSNRFVTDVSFERLAAGIWGVGGGQYSSVGGSLSFIAYTPSQITSTQNNYASIHGRSLQVRLSSDAARTINGITAGVDGEIHIIRNIGNYPISFAHLSDDATGAQVFCDTLAQADLQIGARALLQYDATSGVWMLSKLPNNNLRVAAGYPYSIKQVSGDVEIFKVEDGGQVTVPYTASAGAILLQGVLSVQHGGSILFYDGVGGYTANIYRPGSSVQGVLNLWAQNTQVSGATWAYPNSSPSQITSNQTNYSLAGLSQQVRLSTDATRELQGIAAGVDGEVHQLILTGSNNLTIKHNSGSATGKRIYCHGSADITLAPNDIAHLMFDATTDVWRATADTTGSSTPDTTALDLLFLNTQQVISG